MNYKLKISPAMLVAAVYFSMLLGGVVASLLVLGFILMTENAAPVRRAAITATVICFSFVLLKTIVEITPDTVSLINDKILGTFLKSSDLLKLTSFNKFFNMLSSIIFYARDICMLIFGFMAMCEKYIKIGFIEKIIDKHVKPIEENA